MFTRGGTAKSTSRYAVPSRIVLWMRFAVAALVMSAETKTPPFVGQSVLQSLRRSRLQAWRLAVLPEVLLQSLWRRSVATIPTRPACHPPTGRSRLSIGDGRRGHPFQVSPQHRTSPSLQLSPTRQRSDVAAAVSVRADSSQPHFCSSLVTEVESGLSDFYPSTTGPCGVDPSRKRMRSSSPVGTRERGPPSFKYARCAHRRSA